MTECRPNEKEMRTGMKQKQYVSDLQRDDTTTATPGHIRPDVDDIPILKAYPLWCVPFLNPSPLETEP